MTYNGNIIELIYLEKSVAEIWDMHKEYSGPVEYSSHDIMPGSDITPIYHMMSRLGVQ